MNKWDAVFFAIASYLVLAACAATTTGGVGVPVTFDAIGTPAGWESALAGAVLLGAFARHHPFIAPACLQRLWTRLAAPVVDHCRFVLEFSLPLLPPSWRWGQFGGSAVRLSGETNGVSAVRASSTD